MNKRVTKFLEFKGKNLLFLSKDGIYWIAIKPVCEAINVEYTRAFKNIKEDPILGPALAVQPMQVPNDQVRNLACLPEHLVYGWIFSIKSESAELLEYKKECYQVLFDFFHGTITGRKDIIREKAMIKRERVGLETELRNNDSFVRLENIRAKEARLGILLKRIDSEEFNVQYSIFEEEN